MERLENGKLKLNTLYNGDSIKFLEKISGNKVVDIVLTSPPYNTTVGSTDESSRQQHSGRYDVYEDKMSDEEYIAWQVDLFNKMDTVLKKDGVILYNISYSTDKPSLIYLLIAELINKTNFMVADKIAWKKSSAIPNNVSPNRLTRIVEDVYVFARKSEITTFVSNKQPVKGIESANGLTYYHNITNYITARNNDGTNDLNKATFSTQLVDKLLSIYGKKGMVVFDPFMGTGTTAYGAVTNGMKYLGCELSPAQVEFSVNRLRHAKPQVRGLW